MRWAIVADDLTGAADAAIMFADAGIKTTVWLDKPEDFPEGSCCSVDADARWRDCRTASQLIRQHVSALNEADWLMLKIDSTLRGFVGAMVQAAWGASNEIGCSLPLRFQSKVGLSSVDTFSFAGNPSPKRIWLRKDLLP